MDDKKKTKLANKIIWRIFLFLLVAFTALYISEATGYYEFEQHKRVELNESKIKQFEQDVKDGKDINIKDYVDEVEVSYENRASTIGYTLSSQVENIIENGLSITFDFLGNFFNE